MSRGTFEAMNEARRWLDSGGVGRFEIENEDTMPAWLRAELKKADQNPGYKTPDVLLEHYIQSDPVYGGSPGAQTRFKQQVQETNNTAAKVMKVIKDTAPAGTSGGGGGKTMGDYLKSILGGGGGGGSWAGSPDRMHDAGDFLGHPSNIPGNAYALQPGYLMGRPTRMGPQGDAPGGRSHFPNAVPLSQNHPEAAKWIEKAIRGLVKTRLGMPMNILVRAMLAMSDKAAEGKAQKQMADELMAQQLFAGVTPGGADNPSQAGAPGAGGIPGAPDSGAGYASYVPGLGDSYGYGSIPDVTPGSVPGMDTITLTHPGAYE